jgi:hypothetical protein
MSQLLNESAFWSGERKKVDIERIKSSDSDREEVLGRTEELLGLIELSVTSHRSRVLEKGSDDTCADRIDINPCACLCDCLFVWPTTGRARALLEEVWQQLVSTGKRRFSDHE